MSRNEDNGFGEWGGYMEAKITKLEEQFTKSSDPYKISNLFAGISIYVNGLTNPSADDLKRIMMTHGGVFHHYQRSHTKYIIAANLPDVKVRNSTDTSKIISAQWIVDCLKENRLVDHTKYLLYTNHKPSQPKLVFQKDEKSKIIDEKLDISNIIRELDILNQKMKESSNQNISENVKIDDESHSIPSPEIFRDDDFESKSDIIYETNQTKIPATIVRNSDRLDKRDQQNKPTKTAVDPNFLSEFYSNSRLHHIATLGAGFKQYISELREKHDGIFSARENLRLKLNKKPNFKQYSRIIMHIDMDCFFVSVGLRNRPDLRGLPLAVTHSKGSGAINRPGVDRNLEMKLYLKRLDTKITDNVLSDKIKNGFDGKDSLSEIASCSYEARKMGIKNGMFVGQALKLCPNLKTIQYDFDGYKEVAYTLYNTVAKYTLNIEAVSCDEMFVDLTDLLNDLEIDVMDFIQYVRDEVKSQTGCPCSAGVGENRLQARMATKKAKPDGQFYLFPEIVEEYMSEISTSDLPGVGYSNSYTLRQLNWKTCGDLQKVALGTIQKEFGKKFGETLYQFCRGIDNRALVYGQIRKSVSAEVNYGIRFEKLSELEKFLRQLCTEVHSRLMEIKRKGKCITLKLMIRSKEAPKESSKFLGHGVCDYLTKSVSLSDFTNDLELIIKTVLTINKMLNIPPNELRGIGIQINKLDIPNDDKKENVLKTMFQKVSEKQKEKKSELEVSEEDTKLENNLKILFNNEKQVDNHIDEQIPKKEIPKTSPKQKLIKKPVKKQTGKRKIALGNLNVGDMLQNVSVQNKKRNLHELENIDLDVLAELPEDIQAEIMRDHRKASEMKQTKKNQSKIIPNPIQMVSSTSKVASEKIKVDEDFLAALPPELRKEVEKEIEIQRDKIMINRKVDSEQISKEIQNTNLNIKKCNQNEDNIFIKDNWQDLLQAWIESTDSPELCDIEILCKHAIDLITSKRINDLYTPMKFLFRIIKETNNCSWHQAHKNILNTVQSKMVEIYGSPMLLESNLICGACNNK